MGKSSRLRFLPIVWICETNLISKKIGLRTSFNKMTLCQLKKGRRTQQRPQYVRERWKKYGFVKQIWFGTTTNTARTKVRLLLTQGLSPEEVVRHLGQRTNVINRHSDSATMSEMSLSTRDVRKIRDWMEKRHTYSTIADPHRVHHIVQENMRTSQRTLMQ